MVDDFVAPSEIRVLVTDRVEAVRARGHDLLHARAVQRRDVLAREALERVLIAHPAGGVARACFARPQNRKVDARLLHQLRGRHRGFSRALVERGRAADPEKYLGRDLARLQHTNPKAFCPLHAVGLRLAPWVGSAVDVAQHRARLFWKS